MLCQEGRRIGTVGTGGVLLVFWKFSEDEMLWST